MTRRRRRNTGRRRTTKMRRGLRTKTTRRRRRNWVGTMPDSTSSTAAVAPVAASASDPDAGRRVAALALVAAPPNAPAAAHAPSSAVSIVRRSIEDIRGFLLEAVASRWPSVLPEFGQLDQNVEVVLLPALAERISELPMFTAHKSTGRPLFRAPGRALSISVEDAPAAPAPRAHYPAATAPPPPLRLLHLRLAFGDDGSSTRFGRRGRWQCPRYGTSARGSGAHRAGRDACADHRGQHRSTIDRHLSVLLEAGHWTLAVQLP